MEPVEKTRRFPEYFAAHGEQRSFSLQIFKSRKVRDLLYPVSAKTTKKGSPSQYHYIYLG